MKTSKENDKSSSKSKKVECSNYGGLGYFSTHCSSLKDIKKFMQATWSDTNSEESGCTTFEDARYKPNDFLTYVTSMESVHDSECDSDNDNEFTDDQKVVFLNNLVVEHKN